MKTNSLCYKEFLEFPILPFDPAIFGFVRDVSSASSPAACPSFATFDDKYRLWWNWPHVAEREWYGSISRYFITRRNEEGKHDPDRSDPLILFKTESLSDLVRHLLVTRYSQTPHFLDGEMNESRAIQWFHAIESAQIILHLNDSSHDVSLTQGYVITETERHVLDEYLQNLKEVLGDRLPQVQEKARSQRMAAPSLPPKGTATFRWRGNLGS